MINGTYRRAVVRGSAPRNPIVRSAAGGFGWARGEPIPEGGCGSLHDPATQTLCWIEFARQTVGTVGDTWEETRDLLEAMGVTGLPGSSGGEEPAAAAASRWGEAGALVSSVQRIPSVAAPPSETINLPLIGEVSRNVAIVGGIGLAALAAWGISKFVIA